MKRMLSAVFVVAVFGPLLSGLNAPLLAQVRNEGIAVHGHWVLEVRNPDGVVVERREFENALHALGAFALGKLLNRTDAMGPWGISLYPAASGGPFVGGTLVGFIREPGMKNRTVVDFVTLVLAGASQEDDCEFANGATVVLCGTATASRNGTLTDVGTDFGTCPPDITPAACAGGSPDVQSWPFTKTPTKNDSGVPTPLTLVKGQILQVKVYISFTSP